jgi:hypothetical protein
MNPSSYRCLILDKGQTYNVYLYVGKKDSLQQTVLGKLDIYVQMEELDLYLSSCTKITSKWI